MTAKKHIIAVAVACTTLWLASCTPSSQKALPPKRFDNDVLNGYTPIKDQGHSSTCWIYAMLAAIETERIMKGDSVNLSPDYAARRMLEEQFDRHVLTGGAAEISDRGTASDLLRIMERHGAMPFDSYTTAKSGHSPAAGFSLLARKTKAIAQKAVNSKSSPRKFRPMLDHMLDESLGPVPHHVYMLGAEYTPEEFGRSVCPGGYFKALTSFTHHPFGQSIDLELPDNRRHNLFLNLPLDSLLSATVEAVEQGHGVCWEGDISEPLFSFRQGMALTATNQHPTQQLRQRLFETRRTTDDHCMAIVGIAHDERGQRYFIMKNSWGTANPYQGLMYMSEPYFMLKTIAVWVPCVK